MVKRTSAGEENPYVNESHFSDREIIDTNLNVAETNCVDTESSQETIARILAAYEIGPKLRALRLKKKIALVDLGKHTGLSASMLSQLENGKMAPTLPTLARIAMVFDVGLDYFFADERKRRLFHIVRARERMKFPDRPGNPHPAFFFECLSFSATNKGLEAFLAEFPRREPGEVEEHFHDGSEFLHLLEGKLGFTFQGHEHILKAGDSVYFDSSAPHAYRGMSSPAARALVVTAPPRI